MIYKYFLSNVPVTLNIPADCHILDIQTQGSSICVWIDVDLQSESHDITFTPVMTGEEPPDGFYVGTVQIDGFVLHYYV